jgi:hypothetical protein
MYNIMSLTPGRVYLQNDTTSTPVGSSSILYDSGHTGFLGQTAIVQLTTNEIFSVRCTCPSIGFNPNLPASTQTGGLIKFELLTSSVQPSAKAAAVAIDVVDAVNDLIYNQIMSK